MNILDILNTYTIPGVLFFMAGTIAFWGGYANVDNDDLSKEEKEVRRINRIIITTVSWILVALAAVIAVFGIWKRNKNNGYTDTITVTDVDAVDTGAA